MELPDGRPVPPLAGSERETLDGWLEFHRATLLAKCRGLSDEQLAARSVPPADLSLLGLVRHMSDVERHWFTRVLLGEKVDDRYRAEDGHDEDFEGAVAAAAAEALAGFEADCERSRQVAAAAPSLDVAAVGRWHGMTVSLRWIMVHMVEEYARHNGHADLLRQCVDGSTGV